MDVKDREAINERLRAAMDALKLAAGTATDDTTKAHINDAGNAILGAGTLLLKD